MTKIKIETSMRIRVNKQENRLARANTHDSMWEASTIFKQCMQLFSATQQWLSQRHLKPCALVFMVVRQVSVEAPPFSSNMLFSFFPSSFLSRLLENRVGLPKYKNVLHLVFVSYLIIIFFITIYFILNFFYWFFPLASSLI